MVLGRRCVGLLIGRREGAAVIDRAHAMEQARYHDGLPAPRTSWDVPR